MPLPPGLNLLNTQPVPDHTAKTLTKRTPWTRRRVVCGHPLFGKRNFRYFSRVFDRTCVDGQNRLPKIIQEVELRDDLRQLQAAA